MSVISAPPTATPKIQSFMDLNAWKMGHTLVLSIYAITKEFPSDERYGLTSQLRRAAVSITSNIAEGFRRKTAKEKIQFYTIASGSLTEVHNQLIISRDIHYMTSENFESIDQQITHVGKMLSGLMKSAMTWT